MFFLYDLPLGIKGEMEVKHGCISFSLGENQESRMSLENTIILPQELSSPSPQYPLSKNLQMCPCLISIQLPEFSNSPTYCFYPQRGVVYVVSSITQRGRVTYSLDTYLNYAQRYRIRGRKKEKHKQAQWRSMLSHETFGMEVTGSGKHNRAVDSHRRQYA